MFKSRIGLQAPTVHARRSARGVRWITFVFFALGLVILTVAAPMAHRQASELERLPVLTSQSSLPLGTPALIEGTVHGTSFSPDGFVLYTRERWDVDRRRSSQGSSNYVGGWITLERRVTGPDGETRIGAVDWFSLEGQTHRVTVRAGSGLSDEGIQDGTIADRGLLPGAHVVAVGQVGARGELLAERVYGGTLSTLVANDRRDARAITATGVALTAASLLLLLRLTFLRKQ